MVEEVADEVGEAAADDRVAVVVAAALPLPRVLAVAVEPGLEAVPLAAEHVPAAALVEFQAVAGQAVPDQEEVRAEPEVPAVHVPEGAQEA